MHKVLLFLLCVCGSVLTLQKTKIKRKASDLKQLKTVFLGS